MPKQHSVSPKEGFQLLLALCKVLSISVFFGFPKFMKHPRGGCFYYNYRKKIAKIYLPESYKIHFSHKHNAVLLHEIGHYFSFISGRVMYAKHPMLGTWLIIIEEVTAWYVAIHLSRALGLPTGKDFRANMKMGLNSYLSSLYRATENSILDLLMPLKKAIGE